MKENLKYTQVACLLVCWHIHIYIYMCIHITYINKYREDIKRDAISVIIADCVRNVCISSVFVHDMLLLGKSEVWIKCSAKT